MKFKQFRNVLFALAGLVTACTSINAYAGQPDNYIPAPTAFNAPYGEVEVAASFSNVDSTFTPNTLYGVSTAVGLAWPLNSDRWSAGAQIGYTFVGDETLSFFQGTSGIIVKFKHYAYYFALQLVYFMSDRLSFAGRLGAGVFHTPVEFTLVAGGINITLPLGGTTTNMYAGFSMNYRLFSQIYATVGYDYYNAPSTLTVIKAGLAFHFS